jgi:pyruvate dehydrogenase E1 component alpha subunit
MSMFECFDPRQGKMFCLLDESGTLHAPPEGFPLLNNEQALTAYRAMILARAADEWALSLNRQGRMPTYALNEGQEANSVGALMALRPDDWFVPAFRELGGMLMRGLTLAQYYLYWYGNEEGSRLDPSKYHMMPVSVPVGSQMVHAVGIAWAERYKGMDRVVATFMGEGATSEGDFHEACNLAGVWNSGVIFYVQNNHWAISLPWEKQSASPTVAEKAFAYGFEGVRVDGNDIFAVYAVVKAAAERARRGEGPTLIEGLTYRLGAHTTSDDPSRYRADEDVKRWRERDPVVRLERFLLDREVLTSEDMRAIREECVTWARESFEEVEHTADPTLEDAFRYLYHQMPAILQEQLDRRKG